jgi:8-oxo-dGTP pyrophosphatase MutT (NUDIX family)
VLDGREGEATGITVTATPHFKGQYLLIRRSDSDVHLPGYWGFPGGRVHYYTRTILTKDGPEERRFSETLQQAAIREVLEETGLKTSDLIFYVDSYDSLGRRAAAHFCVDVTSGDVIVDPSEIMDYRWVNSLDEMRELEPRIDGIDNHLAYIIDELSHFSSGPFKSASVLDLTIEKYLNRNDEGSWLGFYDPLSPPGLLE